MGCYHPLKAFVIGFDSLDGKAKKKLKIVPWQIDGKDVHHLEHCGASGWIPSTSDSSSFLADKSAWLWFSIPCGQCIGCRLDYSRMWANRLMMELQDHDPADCWFLTLTYDDEHVPKSFHSETGELTLSLCKRDVQLFNKRLRECFPSKRIRFYTAGEYGDRTFRPHYHGIYFSLHLDGFDPLDRRNIWSRTDQGFTLYHWPRLDEIWGNGRVIIAPVSWDTCAYTARYVTKKLTGSSADVYDLFGISPPFVLMSRKPGIARHYFESIDGFDPSDRISLSTATKGITFAPPRYFKDLWKADSSLEEADHFLLQSKVASDERRDLIKSQNDLARQDWLAYLSSVEKSHEKGSLQLRRDDV